MKLRRSKTEETPVVTLAKPGGKGRATPTRKEAEAAARARAKVPRTRKEQTAHDRQFKSESSQKMRQGMKDGEEKYLLPRDKGPMRRFIRDFVDARFGFAEIVIPMMIISLVVKPLIIPLFAVLAIDLVVLRVRLRKQLATRFPGESTKKTTYYAMTRAMQMKFMRLPKSKMKIGQELPQQYR